MRSWVAIGCGAVISGCVGPGITLEEDGSGSGSGSDTGPIATAADGTIDDGDDVIVDDVFTGTPDVPTTTGYCPAAATMISGIGPTLRPVVADVDGNGVDEAYLIDTFDGGAGIKYTTVIRLDVPFEGEWIPVVMAEAYAGGFAGFHDFDGDGGLELVVSQPDGPMGYPYKFYRLADPDLFDPAPNPIILPAGYRVEFFELNEDGIVDFLGRPDGTTLVDVWLGTGAASFVQTMTVQDFPEAAGTLGAKGRLPFWFATLSRTFSDFGCTDAWVTTWHVDESAILSEAYAGPLGKYDRVLDVADVDGNGLADVFVRVCEDPPGSTYGIELHVGTPEGFTPIAGVTDAGIVEAADLDGNLEVDLVWSSPVDGTLSVQYTAGGAPGVVLNGGPVDPGARAAGHGNLFGDGFEQVIATYPDDTGGRTVIYVGVVPC